MRQQQMHKNGAGQVENRRPQDQIDIYDLAISSTIDVDVLEDVLLGLGNYSSREYWQQVESFRYGLYATEAFGRRIFERAVDQTKTQLAIEGYSDRWELSDGNVKEVDLDGWEDLDEEERETLDRRRWIADRKEEIWETLPEKIQLEVLGEVAGVRNEWTAPHLQMMMMRHEASRSKGARLMDNLFGRVKEHKQHGDGPANGNLLSRLKGGNS